MTLIQNIRNEFPVLNQTIQGKSLIYLDSAATSQKPTVVLDALRHYYEKDNANVHRGSHSLSIRATESYEASRDKLAKFINSNDREEIIFTRNATESINLVAYSWGLNNLKPGDEILTSVMEHHSNLIPWQIIAKQTGANIKYIQLTENEDLDLDHFKSILSKKTKLVSIVHVSNMLGCMNPVEEITRLSHSVGAKVLIDACQSVPHTPIDVQNIDCDWLVASGHKMCGPSGIGFLYGKREILESMPPFLGGGEMIDKVFLDHFTYGELPHKFEAGTPAIAEAIALGRAVDYLTEIGMDTIHSYEEQLSSYLFQRLEEIPDLRIYGGTKIKNGTGRAALASFNVNGIHGSDLSTLLDNEGIAIRSGDHCTQPLHRLLQISGSARASLYFYNTLEEVDEFIVALKETINFFTKII